MLLALAALLSLFQSLIENGTRIIKMEQAEETQKNISVRPGQLTPQLARHSFSVHSSLPTYFQGGSAMHPLDCYKPYSSSQLLAAFASRCGKQKPEEKAARESSPSHCQPFWNHIQPAGQPDFATHLPRSGPVNFQGELPLHPLCFRFPTVLPSSCGERNPEQAATRVEEITKVNSDTSDFPCEFNLEILFGDEKGYPTINDPAWTYSSSLEKLFTKINSMVPIAVRLGVYPPFPCYSLRLVLVFKEAKHRTKIVQRCGFHRSDQEGHHGSQHLVRCENPKTVYATCPDTKQHCLVIPLEAPQAGVDLVSIMFKFMCYNSCPGLDGLNRRAILAIFTMEHNNIIVGRRVIEVRVCSAPGRDRQKEESGMF